MIALIVAGSALYVFAAAAPHLSSVRSVLSGDLADLSSAQLRQAATDLTRARRALNGLPGLVLRLVPVSRQNIRAVDALATDAIDVLEDARRLAPVVAETRRNGLIEAGAVQMDALDDLEEAVGSQSASLRQLEETLRIRRSGWMLPAVWDAFETVHERVSPLADAADRAHLALRLAPDLLGASDGRTYLVLMLNNAELRGAGGVLSSVGTISVHEGEVSLGRFTYHADLDAPSTPRSGVPEDFRRRFGRYVRAGPWINATASPDLPEVAEYVARLYTRTTGARTDGAIVVDPRGLAALFAPDEQLTAPGSSVELTASELPRYAYSDAYSIFRTQRARREALLALGPALLRRILTGGVEADDLERIGKAARGGHLRVVSFDPQERAALESLGVGGDLQDDAVDRLLVTVQNLGADKLDYWMRREVAHECVVERRRATCVTEVTLKNAAPRGLPDYVVQDKRRYATYRGYLEVYVPDDAHVTEYSLDGRRAEVFIEREDGRKSLGTYFTTLRGDQTSVAVRYDLSIDASYSLSIAPQPLTSDARAEVVIDAPEGWVQRGPLGEEQQPLSYRGPLSKTLRFSAGSKPDERSGIPWVWATLTGFL